MIQPPFDLSDAGSIVAGLEAGHFRVTDLVEEVLDRIDRSERPEAWLHVVEQEALLERARELEAGIEAGLRMPLLGIPFAIKDNIDLAGVPTTAGCPAYAWIPEASAECVERLEAAGAIAIGKTHMDQFATGLVGTRSPMGPCRNAHDARYISGGSSSGSGVVVAQEIVTFSLGTDTAGSGRVPAAMNGVLGLKPTRGRVSLRGVLPACASLDCVSVFARNNATLVRVLGCLEGFDAHDPFSREASPVPSLPERFRFGVPHTEAWKSLCGMNEKAFSTAIDALISVGGEAVEFDWQPFAETAELLYNGPFVAERLTAVGDFCASRPDVVDPSVRVILDGARDIDAQSTFAGMHRLSELRRSAASILEPLQCIVVPTVPDFWRIDEVQKDPLATNATLGRTNNFVNLLDMAGLTLPVGHTEDGLPYGVTLCGAAGTESNLLGIHARLEPSHPAPPCPTRPMDRIPLAVVGAHLRDMPLNSQLVELAARFGSAVQTAPNYRFYALEGTVPPKPGLVRVEQDGASIEAEVWWLSPEAFGRFVEAVPAPLAIGTLQLEEGREVPGFVCEPGGIEDATDITHHGGWRAYMASRAEVPSA